MLYTINLIFMFSLDIEDWGNIIFNLITLSFLISSFFIRTKDNFWYKNLSSQTSQDVLNKLQKAWKSDGYGFG